MEYKLSKYNYRFPNGKCWLLNNIATRRYINVVPQIVSLINKYQGNIDDLEKVHPTLFNSLADCGFIVSATINEAEEIVRRWREAEASPRYYSITVLPTLDCNCRCWYCYEKHNAGTMMTPETVERIKKHITQKLLSPKLEHFHIGFFGGEPLMGFRYVVMPLLEYAKSVCEEKSKLFDAHFTTNATLFSQTMINELKALSIPISFQITLDGNREAHDAVRCTKYGKPTFDIIVRNIHRLLKAGFKVGVRVNFTNANIDTTSDIIDQFADLTDEEKYLLNVDFQQVWQDTENNNTHSNRRRERVMSQFEAKELNVQPFRHKQIRCYADCENNVVINYNGDVYKCTAREFDPKKREGVLCEDGHIEFNELYKLRMKIKHTNKLCLDCKILPICMGACSQNELENPERNSCLYHESEQSKIDFVRRLLIDQIKSENNRSN